MLNVGAGLVPALMHWGNREEKQERKKLRLQGYNYSSEGAYFITICTHGKAKLFGEPDDDSIVRLMIEREFKQILDGYSYIICPQYVVMPNHFHALIVIEKENKESLSDIIRKFKSKTTVEYIKMVQTGRAMPFDKKLWQRSYYDHVIRNEQDFRDVWQYIEANPRRWLEDDYY